MESYETLHVTFEDRGVLFVAINRPDIRNAFNEKMISEFTELFSKRVLDPKVRVVVLSGNGAVFCAGGDLNWMAKSIEADYGENLRDTKALSKMFSLMNECPKPLVGLVQGAAIGGGVGLVSTCDYVIAQKDTQFSLSEVRLGIVPACIGPFVISKVGASFARALFISAERFPAQRAREIGLIHEIVATQEELKSAGERLLGNLLQCGPQAMGIAKRLVLDLSIPERRGGLGSVLDYVSKVLADVRVSVEGQEGLRAFLGKRKPNWIR